MNTHTTTHTTTHLNLSPLKYYTQIKETLQNMPALFDEMYIFSASVQCLCGMQVHSGSMIQCSTCFIWLHRRCLGLDNHQQVEILKMLNLFIAAHLALSEFRELGVSCVPF